MISSALKFSLLLWIASIPALMLAGCYGLQTTANGAMAALPLGVYKVVERDCAYEIGAPEACTKTQYIELVKGIFYGVGADEVAFVTWLSEDPGQEHTYVARDLAQGKFIDAHEFRVKDDDLGKEWFVLKEGTISEYFFTRHARTTPHGEMAGKTHLTLRRITRSPEIDRLLPYPEVEASVR